MGATFFDDDDEWDSCFPSGEGCEAQTVVLVGKVGNGKSATVNSILGKNIFDSMPSSVGDPPSRAKMSDRWLRDMRIKDGDVINFYRSDNLQMGGDDNFGFLPGDARNIVLVGKVGNGKSATGNSILGTKTFLSKPSSIGVTGTSELQTTVLEDGQVLNIIDTPGLLDFSREPKLIRDEILKCLEMIKDGIHAVLMVLSIRSRCSIDEKVAFDNLLQFFGGNISDYMIVIFTGGDELDEMDGTLDDYLGGRDCPGPFKEILETCGNRCVLFDNKTKDDVNRCEQLNQLLKLVNEVVDRNCGIPYTDELLKQLKIGEQKLREQFAEVNSVDGYSELQVSEHKEQFIKSYEEKLKRLTDMMDMKLNVITRKLEKQLEEERAARIEAEKVAKEAIEEKDSRLEELKKRNDEELRLKEEELHRAQKEAENLRNRLQAGGCVIL